MRALGRILRGTWTGDSPTQGTAPAKARLQEQGEPRRFSPGSISEAKKVTRWAHGPFDILTLLLEGVRDSAEGPTPWASTTGKRVPVLSASLPAPEGGLLRWARLQAALREARPFSTSLRGRWMTRRPHFSPRAAGKMNLSKCCRHHPTRFHIRLGPGLLTEHRPIPQPTLGPWRESETRGTFLPAAASLPTLGL